MQTTIDARMVAPALEKYEQGPLAKLWKRPALTAPRDRSIVTIAAVIVRNQTIQMPYYFNLALDRRRGKAAPVPEKHRTQRKNQSLWDTVWWSCIAIDGPSGIYFCFSLLPFHGRDRLFGTIGLSYVCPSGRTGRVGGPVDRGRKDLQDNGSKVVCRAAPLGQTATVHAGPFCAGRSRSMRPSYHCA